MCYRGLISKVIVFRAVKSTADAVIQVMDAVHRAKAHRRPSRRIVLYVKLDVSNVFNSVR